MHIHAGLVVALALPPGTAAALMLCSLLQLRLLWAAGCFCWAASSRLHRDPLEPVARPAPTSGLGAGRGSGVFLGHASL